MNAVKTSGSELLDMVDDTADKLHQLRMLGDLLMGYSSGESLTLTADALDGIVYTINGIEESLHALTDGVLDMFSSADNADLYAEV